MMYKNVTLFFHILNYLNYYSTKSHLYFILRLSFLYRNNMIELCIQLIIYNYITVTFRWDKIKKTDVDLKIKHFMSN